MLLFEYILILLIAILISNFINRFISSLSVPIIQIALGIVITFLPLGFQLELNPELFLVLFIAPLLFNDGMLSDKKALWSLKKPIFQLAFGLVFLVVVVMGYFINLLIPAVPLAAAFALAAALAPTDAVAVGSLAKKMNMPHNILNVLEGESLINDASGIVCFQFAIAAMLAGTFSLAQAGGRFVIVALGGVLVGALFTLLKYILVKWIRSLGMENVTLHILIELLTPFLIFLIAERCEVSGILAVVTSGIIHSFGRKQLNPERASLNIASSSIWAVLTFSLNGLVFLILGTQMPSIIKIIWYNSSVSNVRILLYIVIFTLALMLIRFLWSLLISTKKIYMQQHHHMGRGKTALILSMSGVRGAVTLAAAMSIPFSLNDGSPFPERDLIIFIAAGVILCSLLIANFILPLFAEKESETDDKEREARAYIEILHNVIRQLNDQITEENQLATEMVTREYYMRSLHLQQKQNQRYSMSEEEKALRIAALQWEKDNTGTLLAENKLTPHVAERYTDYLNAIAKQITLSKSKSNILRMISRGIGRFQPALKNGRKGRGENRREGPQTQVLMLRTSNYEYILEKLKGMENTKNKDLIHKLISEYEFSLEFLKGMAAGPAAQASTPIEDVASMGFQLERDNIQTMFENGRISRETSKEMRKNISLLEIQIKDEFI